MSGGANSNKSTTGTISSSATPGTYYILFFVDYLSSVTETNESNNVKWAAVNVAAPFTDLYIQTPSVSPTSLTAGGSTSTTCYIYNQGNTSSSSSNIGYYLSTDTLWDANDISLSTYSGSSLASGSSSYRSRTLTIPSSTAAGSYYILFFAD